MNNKYFYITDIGDVWEDCDEDLYNSLDLEIGKGKKVTFKEQMETRYYEMKILAPTKELAKTRLLLIFHGVKCRHLISKLQVARRGIEQLKEASNWANQERFRLESKREGENMSYKTMSTKGETTVDEVNNTDNTETNNILIDTAAKGGASDSTSMMITSESSEEEKKDFIAAMNPANTDSIMAINKYTISGQHSNTDEDRASKMVTRLDSSNKSTALSETSGTGTNKTTGTINSLKENINISSTILAQLNCRIIDVNKEIVELFAELFSFTWEWQK